MKYTHNISLMGSIVLAVASLLPVQTMAEESGTTYEILVVVNRAYGDLVAKGKYQLAIDRIATKPNAYAFATATNLCVAHSMLKQFDEAAPYCNEAIQVAEQKANSVRASKKRREEATDKWAHAYSNRGVLRAMSGDTSGAEADFQNALVVRPGMDAATNNFALLGMESGDHVVSKAED